MNCGGAIRLLLRGALRSRVLGFVGRDSIFWLRLWPVSAEKTFMDSGYFLGIHLWVAITGSWTLSRIGHLSPLPESQPIAPVILKSCLQKHQVFAVRDLMKLSRTGGSVVGNQFNLPKNAGLQDRLSKCDRYLVTTSYVKSARGLDRITGQPP